MKRVEGVQTAVAPALARRWSASGACSSETLAQRVAFFFQVVDKSEALLLDEIDALRARVDSTGVSGVVGCRGGDGDKSRWQDMQVYLRERRLEQAAITRLLEGEGATAAYQVDAVTLESSAEMKAVVVMAELSPHDQAWRMAELERSNNQLAAHVRELDAAVAALRTRLDMTSSSKTALQSRSVGGVDAAQHMRLAAGSLHIDLQTAPPCQNIGSVVDQRAVENQSCVDLQSLRAELIDARREQAELDETVAMLRRMIKTQRKTNDSLTHSLHVRDQHFRQCWSRINSLWE